MSLEDGLEALIDQWESDIEELPHDGSGAVAAMVTKAHIKEAQYLLKYGGPITAVWVLVTDNGVMHEDLECAGINEDADDVIVKLEDATEAAPCDRCVSDETLDSHERLRGMGGPIA